MEASLPEDWNTATEQQQQQHDVTTATSPSIQHPDIINNSHKNNMLWHEPSDAQDTTLSQSQQDNVILSSSERLEQDSISNTRVTVRETGYDSMRSYIKTMCNHELLNKNEEVILGREVQILIQWEAAREQLQANLQR